MKLEYPNRIVSLRAQTLADAIDAIRELSAELDEARRYCDAHDAASLEIRIGALDRLWDALSQAIEEPLPPRCGICGSQPEKLLQDPAGQHPAGICEACWNESIYC